MRIHLCIMESYRNTKKRHEKHVVHKHECFSELTCVEGRIKTGDRCSKRLALWVHFSLPTTPCLVCVILWQPKTFSS